MGSDAELEKVLEERSHTKGTKEDIAIPAIRDLDFRHFIIIPLNIDSSPKINGWGNMAY